MTKKKKDNPSIGVRIGVLEAEVKDHNFSLKNLTKEFHEFSLANIKGHIEILKDLGYLKSALKYITIGVGLPLGVVAIIEILKRLGLVL